MLWRICAVVALLVATAMDFGLGLFKSPGLYPWVGAVSFACIVLPAFAWVRPSRVAAFVSATACLTFTLVNPVDREFGLAETLALTGVVAVTAHRARTAWDVPLVLLVVASVATQPLQQSTDVSSDVFAAMGLLIVALSVAAVAAYVRLLGVAREKEVAAVRSEQRAEFARDLHDFVGHHITGMVVLAQGAGRIVERNPARAREALERIEEAGGEAMSAMRRMIGMLRDDVPVAPAGGIADIEPLVAAEPRAKLHLRGDTANLPPEIAGSVYRVVMESLTNFRKHAAQATAVDVRIESTPDHVSVRITDDGRPAKRGRGFGLVGLAERVQATGGRLSAGPGDHGGWVVDAVLPTGKVNA